jgi:class 3 adenylate cyclase/tetratricopeptide (TPR) repeat protein
VAVCGACGTENPAGQKFCGECAAPVTRGCPSCGAVAGPTQKFCGECAAPLGASGGPPVVPVQPATPAGPVAERRVCSVLFADLVGFTPLAESRDPEEVREFLSRYFDAARTVIGRYGGTVEKFIGDAVMAVWGTPVTAEGDAERAVRAALDVVDAVAALGTEVGAPELSARAGVVTGEVAVTLGAHGEGMVAGDAVNTAARVQAAAEPGTVLVEGTTRRLAGAAVGFEDAGEHTLKGKAEPERLWRATRVLAMVGGSQRVDGLEAPLTGRDAELRTIRELFHAAAERRTPRMVVVTGAAGVGKSRLGWEFEKYMDGLAQRIAWHRGRCLSYGEGVAFWALAEAVRQRLGIAEQDPTDVAAGKLATGVREIVADPAEREYVAVRLGRLLGVPVAGDPGGQLGREELFAGWRMFFERLAGDRPVVWLVEDAQYADPGLLDFLDHLVDWARDLPIFLLILARPELDERRPGFGLGRNRSTLTLDPLDTAAMDRLVDELVPGMPAATRQAITGHAQGVPLFAVETVRSLVDRDVVQPIDGVYRLVGDVGELAVPDSLHGLLAARLDGLDPPVRALAADAAVVGTTFPAEALVAVSGRPDDEVRAGLADLVRREVLEVSADRLSPQRGSYRFAQQLLRQTAYDTLSRRDRKARHLAVAAHLRASFADDGEEAADVIARHYLDALAAVPDDPDADDIRGQAITMALRAAERAVRAGAPATAAANYATAAELAELAGVPEAAGYWERAATADLFAADFGATIRHAERARRLYQAAGDSRSSARAQAVAGGAHRRAGRHTVAREQLTDALAVLRADPDRDTVVALNELATLETFAGGPDAERLSAEALELGQALDIDDALSAQLFICRGIMHYFTNRTMQAAAACEYGARLAERAGDSAVQGRALLNLAEIFSGVDPPAALAAARAAAEAIRRMGRRDWLAAAVGNLASVLLDIGDWSEAEKVLTAAVTEDGLDDQEELQVRHGKLAALRGDSATAASALEALTSLRVSEDPQQGASLALMEAVSAEAVGETAEALKHARKVVGYAGALSVRHEHVRWAWPLAARAAHELDDRAATEDLLALLDGHPVGHLPPILRAERDLARARLAAADDPAAAGPLFEQASAALRRLPAPYHLAHAVLDQAEYLTARGAAEGAARAVEEAASIAERLGAAPLAGRAASQGTASAGSPPPLTSARG